MWNKIKPILLTFALLWLIGSCIITKTKADTAISTNILPNAGTTSSNMDNFDLDGVQSGSTGFLNNNSTHNGFDITCQTQVLKVGMKAQQLINLVVHLIQPQIAQVTQT